MSIKRIALVDCISSILIYSLFTKKAWLRDYNYLFLWVIIGIIAWFFREETTIQNKGDIAAMTWNAIRSIFLLFFNALFFKSSELSKEVLHVEN
jgi:hypothetical protein